MRGASRLPPSDCHPGPVLFQQGDLVFSNSHLLFTSALGSFLKLFQALSSQEASVLPPVTLPVRAFSLRLTSLKVFSPAGLLHACLPAVLLPGVLFSVCAKHTHSLPESLVPVHRKLCCGKAALSCPSLLKPLSSGEQESVYLFMLS